MIQLFSSAKVSITGAGVGLGLSLVSIAIMTTSVENPAKAIRPSIMSLVIQPLYGVIVANAAAAVARNISPNDPQAATRTAAVSTFTVQALPLTPSAPDPEVVANQVRFNQLAEPMSND